MMVSFIPARVLALRGWGGRLPYRRQRRELATRTDNNYGVQWQGLSRGGRGREKNLEAQSQGGATDMRRQESTKKEASKHGARGGWGR